MAIIAAYFSAFQFLTLCVGVPGNALILVCYGRKSKKLGTDVLIMSLACLDLFASLFTVTKVAGTVQIDAYCKFVLFTRTGVGFSQLTMTLFISIDRYTAVCKPFNRRITVRQAILGSILCTFIAFVFNAPILWMSHYSKITRSCIYVHNVYLWHTLFVKIVSPTWYFPCIILSSLLYARTILALRHQRRVRAALTGPKSLDATTTGYDKGTATTTNVTSVTEPSSDEDGRVPVRSLSNRPQSDQAVQLEEGPSKALKTSPPLAQQTSNACVSETVLSISNATLDTSSIGKDSKVMEVSADHMVKQTASQENQGSQSENRVTLMLGITTAIFFLTWMPAIVMNLMPFRVLTGIYAISDAVHTTMSIMYRFFEINSFINAFIYWGLNTWFRKSCREILVMIKTSIRNRMRCGN